MKTLKFLKRFLAYSLLAVVGFLGIVYTSLPQISNAAPVPINNPSDAQRTFGGTYCTGIESKTDDQWCIQNPYFKWSYESTSNYWRPVMCVHPRNVYFNSDIARIDNGTMELIPLYFGVEMFQTVKTSSPWGVSSLSRPNTEIKRFQFRLARDNANKNNAAVCGTKNGSSNYSIYTFLDSYNSTFNPSNGYNPTSLNDRLYGWRSFDMNPPGVKYFQYGHWLAYGQKEVLQNSITTRYAGNANAPANGIPFRPYPPDSGNPPEPEPNPDPDPIDPPKIPPWDATDYDSDWLPVWITNWPPLEQWFQANLTLGEAILNGVINVANAISSLSSAINNLVIEPVVEVIIEPVIDLGTSFFDALRDFFFPTEYDLLEARNRLVGIAEDSFFGEVGRAVEDFSGALSELEFSGCRGPKVEFEVLDIGYSGYPLSACEEPMKGLADFSRLLISVLFIASALFALTRYSASVFGYTAVGTGAQ